MAMCTLSVMSRKSAKDRPYATNLRRLMARLNMTMDQVVSASELNERTVKGLLRGCSKPHPRTLHRLAAALHVSVDEFFWPSAEVESSTSKPTDREILRKVDMLLASPQRNLLVELVDVLSRCSNPSESEIDNLAEPCIAGIPRQ